MTKNKTRILFFLMTICCFANIVSANNSLVSVPLSLFEHAIFLTLFFQQRFYYAFLAFLLFSSASLEVDTFVVQSAMVTRYSFFDVPFIHGMLYSFEIIGLCVTLFPLARKGCKSTFYGKRFFNWILFFLITGVITAIITCIFDDNGLRSASIYPKATILEILSYLYRFSIFIIAIVYVYYFNKEDQISEYCQLVLISLVFSSALGAIMGFVGYYGDEITMLSSLAVGFTPCLLLFSGKTDNKLKVLSIISAVMIILISFKYPAVIGAKWYLIIGIAVVCALYRLVGFQTIRPLAIGAVVILLLVPFLVNALSQRIDTSSYVGYKLTMALRTVNIFGAGSAEDWAEGMGDSPLFRFDELHNISVEYTEKPLFALTGKGLAGSTRHYTDLLSWETISGAFSQEEIKAGAYYEMHESLAQIFLRHGISGIIFFLVFLILLFKSIPKTPWSLCAFLWLFFYWDYGASFTVGMVSVVLVLKCLDKNKSDVSDFNK